MSNVTAIAPWFGSNRMLASEVGKELAGCKWIGVPFAGGMSEVMHFTARTILVNDKHRHVINLARVSSDPAMGPQLYRRVKRKLYHPDELAQAQAYCGAIEGHGYPLMPKLEWAEAYFVACWMGRHAKAGTEKEFEGGLSFRWNANGGDSATHYWSAVESLREWRKLARRLGLNFCCMDFAPFFDGCKDEEETGIYSDAPFPGPGDAYKHTFGIERQRELAERLARFQKARVVVRFYDVPLIRELYPADRWTWRHLKGRKASNAESPEVLLINGPSLVEPTGNPLALGGAR
jgi:DNA adenine methylase